MSAPGNREVAHRLFAAEFNDATYSYSESDEERAPNYVVSPTGARINRLFAVGVLTEVTRAGEEILRARVVDPTGAFVVYAGQYQPEAMNFLERADPPAFVAVTGKARTFQPDDSDVVYTSVRPESVSEVDADTRDRWTVGAAERTLERIGTFAAARDTGLSGNALREALADAGVDASLAAGIPIAIEQYDTSGAYLAALQDLALDATRQVAGEVDEVEGLDLAPGEGGDASPAFEPAVPAALDITPAAAGTMAAATDAEEMTATADAESRETESEVAAGRTADSGPEAAPDAESGSGSEPEPEPESESDVGTEAEPATAGPAGDAAPEDTGGGEGEGEEEEPDFDAVDAGDVESTEKESDEGPGREPEVASGEGDAAAELDETLDAESEEFELDEETRREVEEEYGTEFSTGSEVAPAGEADIETPDRESEPASADVEGAAAAGNGGEGAPADESGGDGEGDEEPDFDAVDAEDVESTQKESDEGPGREPAVASGDEDADEELSDRGDDFDEGDVESTEKGDDDGMSREPVSADEDAGPATDDETAPDVEIEDALIEAMDDLDDGDGAPRDELIERVAAETGADAADVEDAIQDALMSGQCYEPEDDRLKSI